MRISPASVCLQLLLWIGFELATGVVGQAKPVAAEDLFRDAAIPEIELILSRDALAALGRSPRKYVAANLREGNRVYTNVAVHLKGSVGSFRQLQDTPAFTLNFGRLAPGQTFHGLKKIHLNNSVQDRSYLHEKISRELFEQAGVAVPRAGNAWVSLNGRELGMYVLLEGVNKQFLKRYFKDVTGNVYDGHAGSDVNTDMPTNSGENRRDKSRLRALARAAAEPDLAQREKLLEATLDLDRFLSFVALELILGHWDGYSVGRNNFRVYHDRDTDRMVFLPHGLDQVLARRFSLMPENPAGLVARAVLEVPALRERYRQRYAEIATNVFDVTALTNRILSVSPKIDEVLARHDPGAATEHARSAARFARRIQDRAGELQRLLAPVPPVQFDAAGVVRLTNWYPKLDLGEAQLDQPQESTGSGALHIATQKGCTASWRTSVALPVGEYRLLARIRTKGVILQRDDPKAGAGLRISGHQQGQKNAGSHEWTPIFFDFTVDPNRPKTELVCELRAKRGEICYDLSSLKIIRK